MTFWASVRDFLSSSSDHLHLHSRAMVSEDHVVGNSRLKSEQNAREKNHGEEKGLKVRLRNEDDGAESMPKSRGLIDISDAKRWQVTPLRVQEHAREPKNNAEVPRKSQISLLVVKANPVCSGIESIEGFSSL